jgi:hypothetical protein
MLIKRCHRIVTHASELRAAWTAPAHQLHVRL